MPARADNALVGSRTVAVEFEGLSDEGYRRVQGLSLEKMVLVRLVQEGFAVIGKAAGPEIVIRLDDTSTAVTLVAKSAGGELKQSVPLANVNAAELQLELSQKIIEMARALPSPRPPAKMEPMVKPAVAPPAPVQPLWRFGVLAGAGAMFRAGGADTHWRLEGLLRRGEKAELGLGVSLAPSRANEIRVYETAIDLGGGFRSDLAHSLSWSLGLRFGLQVHSYDLTGAQLSNPSGTALDPLLLIPAAIRWRSASGFTVGARFALRAIPRAREHVMGETTLWRRGPVGAELGLVAGWEAP